MTDKWKLDEMVWEYGQPGVFRWTEVRYGLLVAVAAYDWTSNEEVRYYTPTAGWRLAGFRTSECRHNSSRALRRVIREHLGIKSRCRGRLVRITIRLLPRLVRAGARDEESRE
jgi:hypothetical protein